MFVGTREPGALKVGFGKYAHMTRNALYESELPEHRAFMRECFTIKHSPSGSKLEKFRHFVRQRDLREKSSSADHRVDTVNNQTEIFLMVDDNCQIVGRPIIPDAEVIDHPVSSDAVSDEPRVEPGCPPNVTMDDISARIPRSTQYNRRKRQLLKEAGVTIRKYTRQKTTNACSKCGQPKRSETGHRCLFGYTFCSRTEIDYDQWRNDVIAKRATEQC